MVIFADIGKNVSIMDAIRILLAISLIIIFPFISLTQTPEFNNPIAEQRADPWVFKTNDGTYYLIATVPEYDRIVLRKAKSINAVNTLNIFYS